MMRRAGQAARPTTREAVVGRESVRSGDGQAIVLPPKCQRESRAVAAEAWRMGSVMGVAVVSKEVGRRRDSMARAPLLLCMRPSAQFAPPHRRRQCGAQPIALRVELHRWEDRPLKYCRLRSVQFNHGALCIATTVLLFKCLRWAASEFWSRDFWTFREAAPSLSHRPPCFCSDCDIIAVKHPLTSTT
jgi:hypothetical protein